MNLITTCTIAFSLLILGAALCVFLNADAFIKKWRKEICIIPFLEDGLSETEIKNLRRQISQMPEVDDIVYVTKEEALARLRSHLKGKEDILDGLETNPLPASMEVRLKPAFQDIGSIKGLARKLRSFKGIEEVQYGEAWIERFMMGFKLAKVVAWVIFGLLFIATVFIIAGTIKLTIYSRREELEIMRLVGATDLFLKGPFYIEGVLYGLVGAVLAVGILFGIYYIFISKAQVGPHSIGFLPDNVILEIIGIGMGLGLFGSFISFRGSTKR
jgi:cell division transport system permease protein